MISAVMSPEVQESLKRLEEEGWESYLGELRRLERIDVDPVEAGWDDYATEYGQFLRSDPGHPLGPGTPSGRPLGFDGAHIERWKALLRWDPCSYCGRVPEVIRDPQTGALGPSGTVDHVVPRKTRNRETETWLNMLPACGACNSNKGHTPLLEFMRVRARAGDRSARREREAAESGAPMVEVSWGNGVRSRLRADDPLASGRRAA